MSALIFDRTQADTDRAAYLIGKIQRRETLTESEQAEYNAGLRGCYNITDLNRVEAKVRELAETLRSYGYSVDYTVPLKGASVLPSGYTQLEYIQSSGTQYIDTRLLCNKSDYYELEMEVQLTNNSAHAGANGYMQFQASITGGAKCRLKVVYQDNIEKIYVDDALKLTKDWTSDYNGENVRIGLLKLGDAGDSWYNTSNIQSGKIYFVNIKKDGIYVRKYIPAKNSSGILGLFDTVNSVFYKNSGSGTFTAGNEIVGDDREWQYTDTMLESDVLLYLANIAALRDVIKLPPDVPPIPTIDRWIDWMAANDIERIVYELDRMIYGIVPLFRRCGTFRAGKNAQHLLLAKGVN